MMTLRCTRKLLERLYLPNDLDTTRQPSPPNILLTNILLTNILLTNILLTNIRPTTALGDWYATILFTRPSHLILGVSERSRLCVLLPARELNTLRFQEEVRELLQRIGAPEEEAEREVREMSPLAFASTKAIPSQITFPAVAVASRSVLGSMNDYMRMVKVCLQRREWTPRDLSEQLSETPCGPLGMRCPKEVTRNILSGTSPSAEGTINR